MSIKETGSQADRLRNSYCRGGQVHASGDYKVSYQLICVVRDARHQAMFRTNRDTSR